MRKSEIQLLNYIFHLCVMFDFKYLFCLLLTPLYPLALYMYLLNVSGFPYSTVCLSCISVGVPSFAEELKSYQFFIIYHIITLCHDLPTIGEQLVRFKRLPNGNFYSHLML